MCHGHPHDHTCGHSSLTWHYCPSAKIELDTGYEHPCTNITFANGQPSTANCPLDNCDFISAGGNSTWWCCKCDKRNTTGWCTGPAREPKWKKNPINDEWEWIDTCDHGCCKNCRKETPIAAGEAKKKKGSKSKSHSSSASAFDMSLDYGSKSSSSKSKSSSSSSSSGSSSSGSKKREHKHHHKHH